MSVSSNKGRDVAASKTNTETLRRLGKAIKNAQAARRKAGMELMKCLKAKCNPSESMEAFLQFSTIGPDPKSDVKHIINLLSQVTLKDYNDLRLCSQSKCLTAMRTYFEQSKLLLIASLELIQYLITKIPQKHR
jgi:hypothetical protein